ncbi:MAG: flap endonuclease-1 [Candidatus Nitrosotenuis sp.]
MGLDLKGLLTSREKIKLESLTSKVIAVDAYNTIYQFLSIIRGPDGSLLSDSKGRVTSHLSGLFYRNVNFLSLGIKPIYIFDGRPPSLKAAEIEKRKQTKKEATIKYEKAVADRNFEDMRKYAQQTTIMQDGMVDDAKQLLDLFGIPHIQAPSEGEATAAHLTKTDLAYAAASQDYDSILFGAKRLVRNFTNSGRRKLPNRNTYIDVEPEMIDTARVLHDLDVTKEQLVDIGILIGTDFNPDGFERVGPKTALKYIKEHGRLEDVPQIQEQLTQIDYKQIRKIFLEPKVADVSEIKFGTVNYSEIIRYLSSERNFSKERLESSLGKLQKATQRRSHTLEQWFS